jgi:DtxR family transcriptional regulator, Mn-dependent transcriptional regulator
VTDTSWRVDPNAVTETLEVLLDRRERGERCTVTDLVEALPFDAREGERVIASLHEAGALTATTGSLELTDEGYELAMTSVRRHRLTERLLLDVIGLDWWKVHHEAERWEGVISDDVERQLIELLEDPGTCPHGNPIPGSSNRPDQSSAIRLDEAPAGPVRVVRITETLEADDEALQLLEGCGFIPGRDAEVKQRRDGWVEVAGSIHDAALPPHIATHTYVLPT